MLSAVVISHRLSMKGLSMDSTTSSTSSPAANKKDKGSVIAGVVLIVMGLLFLADNFLDIPFSDLWPLILVAIGAGLLWRSRGEGKREGEGA
jgi:phage shock protein C